MTIIEEAYTQVLQHNRPLRRRDVGCGHDWREGTRPVSERTPFRQDGIRERIHYVAPNIVWNEVTVKDPVTLEKPWSFTFAYRKMPDYKLLEYVCEDNREFADDKGIQRIRIGPREQ